MSELMAGQKIGQAIARDVIADGLDRRWSGIDAQDADQLTAIGLEPGTPEWAEAEEAARVAYEAEIGAAAEGGDS